MKLITVSGRIGTTPEIRQTTNGDTYVKFKICNHDRWSLNKKEEVSFWYWCYVYNNEIVKWVKDKLYVGQNVIISGRYCDEICKKDSIYYILRQIKVNDINFILPEKFKKEKEEEIKFHKNEENIDDLPF